MNSSSGIHRLSALAGLLFASVLGAQSLPNAALAAAPDTVAMMDDMEGGAAMGGGSGGSMAGSAGGNGGAMGMGMGGMGMGGMGGGSMTPRSGNAMQPQQMRPQMSRPGNMDMMGSMRRGAMRAGGMQGMPPMSALPGFPGASHLYHVGATGFFLDHPQHITLSTEQQAAINRIKERWQLDQGSFERRIEDAEQELWTLTAADAPDIAKVDEKVRAIEKLRADERLAFIRAVGEAARGLSADQRAVLLGNKSAAAAPASKSMR